MVKSTLYKKLFSYNKFTLLIFFLSLYFLASKLNLNYLSTNSPDFQYYKDYIEYFFHNSKQTGREQGLLYFFLVSFVLKNGQNHFAPGYEFELISNAIQITNFLLYFIGLAGLFMLLHLKGFKINNILISFIGLNFLPQTINLLITMKPEILAFALLTWILYYFEKFVLTKKFNFLLYTIIPGILLLTTKGSIVGMTVLVFILLIAIHRKSFTLKNIFLILLLITLFSSPILIENFKANQILLIDHTPGSTTIDMNQIAASNFIYHINFLELFTNPYKNTHADSLIGIILLDTFGDYFQWYAYNDHNALNYFKKEIKSIYYVTHWRQFFSIVLSLIFYLLCFFYGFKKSKNKIYLFLPILGISILLIQAYGFPSRNFNAGTAELFKSHYYAFLFLISASFLFTIVLDKKKLLGIFLIIVVISNTFYLYNFYPIENNTYESYIKNKNQYSYLCKLNSQIYNEISSNRCLSNQDLKCEVKNPIQLLRENISNDKKSSALQIENNKYLLFNIEKQLVVVNNLNICNNLLKKGYIYKSDLLNNLNYPFFNLIYFMIFFINAILQFRVSKR